MVGPEKGWRNEDRVMYLEIAESSRMRLLSYETRDVGSGLGAQPITRLLIGMTIYFTHGPLRVVVYVYASTSLAMYNHQLGGYLGLI